MSKKDLISKIRQFFLNNEVQDGVVDLCQLGRNFETSTGTAEGEIEIVSVTEDYFVYTPAGDSEEIEGDFEVLSESDLSEILSALEDYKADQDRTFKRAGL